MGSMFTETAYAGVGFVWGSRSCLIQPAQILGTPGVFAWGGAASTAFWVDPHEDLIVVFMTQLMPSSSYPLRRELRALTYAALID
jgi:CubicO group peptidase (beta-lactamase class C family)